MGLSKVLIIVVKYWRPFYRKEAERRSASLPSLILEPEVSGGVTEAINLVPLRKHFNCPVCDKFMGQSQKIFQCNDGHILCETCEHKMKECPECNLEINGRNFTMERIAKLLFHDGPENAPPNEEVAAQEQPTAPTETDGINLTSISDTSV